MDSKSISIAFRVRLDARLKAIADKDRDLIMLLVGRCTLRALPLLLVDGQLGEWQESERVNHLLAVWFAATLCYAYPRTSSQAEIAASAAYAAVTKVDGNTDFPQYTKYITYCAYAAAKSFSNTTIFAASAVESTVNIDHEFLESIDQDLNVLDGESHHQLHQLPLWHGDFPSESFGVQLVRWSRALIEFGKSEAAINHPLAGLLEELFEHYGNILNGGYLPERATAVTERLYQYFKTEELANTQEPEKSKRATKEGAKVKSRKKEPAKKTSGEEAENQPVGLQKKYRAPNVLAGEQPIHQDHLGRENIYTALAAILADPNNNGHQTIGLLGDWGSGKSTWINLLKGQLEKYHDTQPFLVSTFNAWSYENTPNLQAGIAHELIKALVKPPVCTPWSWAIKVKPEKPLTGVPALKLNITNAIRLIINLIWRFWDWLRASRWELVLKVLVACKIHGFGKVAGVTARFLAAIVPIGALFFLLKENYQLIEGSLFGSLLNTFSGKVTAVVGSLMGTVLLIHKSCAEQWKTIWATPQAKELLTYLKLPDYAKHLGEIPVMRKTLEKFCDVRLKHISKPKVKDGHTRLIVVVDDLDRCGHKQIVKVFEAVRLVLEIEHVTVIIAVDQHIALAALALHYKDLASHHKLASPRAIARDYLAKVIHLPITIRPPDHAGVETLLQKIWEKTEVASKRKEDEKTKLKGSTSVQPVSSFLQGADQKTMQAESAGDASSMAEALSAASEAPDSVGAIQVESGPGNQARSLEINLGLIKGPKIDSTSVQILIGLSDMQKYAFIYWVKYFNLSNPRQLKRLNNTYSLLLNAHIELEQAVIVNNARPSQAASVNGYPILIALITLEYLNSLEDSDLRKVLKSHLQAANKMEVDHSIVSNKFIGLFKRLKDMSGLDLIEVVEPFVLPAIECDMASAKPAIRPIDKTEQSAEFA